jgi:hypothetical protein
MSIDRASEKRVTVEKREDGISNNQKEATEGV